MKKHSVAFVLLLCFVCLTGCGGKSAEADGESAESPEISALADLLNSAGESAYLGQYDDDDTDDAYKADERISPSDSAVLIREDTENLISIRIDDGRAELIFNLDRWDMLHDIYENAYYPVEEISEGPFYIVTAKSGRIKDACIGKIDDLFEGYLSLRDFITPTVVLLMEDGSLEFLRADPYMGLYMFGNASLYSHGELPWLKDIVSLSYENVKNGIGGMTIFAQDKDGLLYDIQRLYTMVGIFDEEWLFRQEREGYPYWRYCTLQLYETNNAVSFSTGLNDGWGIWDYGWYEGFYEISLAENAPDGRRPGLITLNLSMTGGESENERIVGTYFIQNRDGITMELWHSDGDHLAYMDDEPLTDFYFFLPGDPEYDFWGNTYNGYDGAYDGYGEWDGGFGGGLYFDDDIVIVTVWDDSSLDESFDDPMFGYFGMAGYSNKTMIDYLLYSVQEARERVQALGMAALCYGEGTMLNSGGLCRDVFLGTNRPDQFVREIHYTISSSGDIYEYDPVEDAFHIVYIAGQGVG